MHIKMVTDVGDVMKSFEHQPAGWGSYTSGRLKHCTAQFDSCSLICKGIPQWALSLLDLVDFSHRLPFCLQKNQDICLCRGSNL